MPRARRAQIDRIRRDRLRRRINRARALTLYNSLQHEPLAEEEPTAPANEANTVVEEDDDCVAIVEPIELIEISDNDEEPDKPDLKRSAAEDSISSLPLKMQKVESLNPGAARSPGHYSEDSADAELLPGCVDTYKDALRLLKPLEEFALLEENGAIIGLLIQLEKIFKRAIKQLQNVK